MNPSIQATKNQLAQAKAHLERLTATGEIDFAAWRAAYQRVLTAQRELAEARGDEYAIDLAIDVKWDVGAPMPFLIADGRKAAVLFYLSTKDPNWDGTSVRVVDPTDPAKPTEQLGIICFDGVYEVRFGGLNDEAIEGHPLSGKGLDTYSAQQVVNSQWIAESERRNSVHSNHQGGWHERMKHYVLTFHDQTLECLARDLRTERFTGSYSDGVRAATSKVFG